MKRSIIVLGTFLVFVWLGVLLAQTPGPPKTYTLQWNHDGANTDNYVILVDGVNTLTVPLTACTGTPKVCTSPLTMTTNVNHVVIVQAVNVFGAASSDPFSAAPPSSRPVGVVVR
jgi:hypothetical protein